MITLKELRWSNAFSYGKDNSLIFTSSPLTQLIGKNGHGKSSIALILEEVLFNKNSKGIKKSDILNRYVKDKAYTIELDLDKDADSYTIKSTRSSTQTVKLLKNGVDISAHTATATYKIIEEVLGFDHKAFSQIVYQSSASSLEFLTATDSNRKKFLIELLNLSKYSRAAEIFKGLASSLSKDIAATQATVDTISNWLSKYSKTSLEILAEVPVPIADPAITNEAIQIEGALSVLEKENKRIIQNNTYKTLQSKISLTPVELTKEVSADNVKASITEANKVKKDAKAFIAKMKLLHGNCPTCLQSIDEAKINTLITEQEDLVLQSDKGLLEFNAILAEIEDGNAKHIKAIKAQQDWEKYHTLIDVTLPSDLLDKEGLEGKLTGLKTSIAATEVSIAQATAKNTTITAHNTKVDTISKQLVEFNSELEEASGKLNTLSDRMSILNILTKTFSTTGLVAYKIECLVKDLEDLTNTYLVDLSDGRFQLSFQISTSDKLNVVITDNGRDIDITALSSGELARVNASALLAIRKLMQSLSSSRINLLILDETVETLDIDGKEKLVEILLKEEALNTVLVSHGFNHPLLEKIPVIKENNISRIEL